MNVFQQIFAEVSPRTSEFSIPKKENKTPNLPVAQKIVTEAPQKKSKTPTYTTKNLPIPTKKPLEQKRASHISNFQRPKKTAIPKNYPATSSVSVKLPAKVSADEENIMKYQLSQKESDVDKKLSAKNEQLQKIREEIEEIKQQIENEKKSQATLSADNQLLQNYIENAETFEQKKARIRINFEAQLKEREQFWEEKVQSLNAN